ERPSILRTGLPVAPSLSYRLATGPSAHAPAQRAGAQRLRALAHPARRAYGRCPALTAYSKLTAEGRHRGNPCGSLREIRAQIPCAFGLAALKRFVRAFQARQAPTLGRLASWLILCFHCGGLRAGARRTRQAADANTFCFLRGRSRYGLRRLGGGAGPGGVLWRSRTDRGASQPADGIAGQGPQSRQRPV